MATRDRVKAQREASKPLSREDLKELVVALGGLVRESVREEVTKVIETEFELMRELMEKRELPKTVPTITKIDHEAREITVGLREHVDGEVVAKRERGGMLGP